MSVGKKMEPENSQARDVAPATKDVAPKYSPKYSDVTPPRFKGDEDSLSNGDEVVKASTAIATAKASVAKDEFAKVRWLNYSPPPSPNPLNVVWS